MEQIFNNPWIGRIIAIVIGGLFIGLAIGKLVSNYRKNNVKGKKIKR